jgi:hypothetical protein
MLFTLPAQALTISNTDPDPHTVTVKAGGDSTELVVEPQMAVEPPCAAGCTVQLENGELYDMKGGEEVSIEGGVIFVDTVPGSDDDSESQDSAEAPSDAAPQAQ